MKAFFLAYGSDKLICEAETSDANEHRLILGAFIPGKEGNYYKAPIISFVKEGTSYQLGLLAWWEWCKKSIQNGHILIDDEFSFNPEHVRIVRSILEID